MLDALCYGLSFEIAFDENLEDVAPILFFGNAIDSSFEVFERTEIVEESPCGPRTSKASFSKVPFFGGTMVRPPNPSSLRRGADLKSFPEGIS